MIYERKNLHLNDFYGQVPAYLKSLVAKQQSKYQNNESLKQQLSELSQEQAKQLLQERIAEELSHVLQIQNPKTIDVNKGFFDLGF